MSLTTRLQRLSGPNPVQSVKLTPEDWPEIERIMKDAERYREMPATLDAIIDAITETP